MLTNLYNVPMWQEVLLKLLNSPLQFFTILKLQLAIWEPSEPSLPYIILHLYHFYLLLAKMPPGFLPLRFSWVLSSLLESSPISSGSLGSTSKAQKYEALLQKQTAEKLLCILFPDLL